MLPIDKAEKVDKAEEVEPCSVSRVEESRRGADGIFFEPIDSDTQLYIVTVEVLILHVWRPYMMPLKCGLLSIYAVVCRLLAIVDL